MLTKRVKLLQSVKRFHVEQIARSDPYDKNVGESSMVVWRLEKRIKKALRKKVKVTQLAFIQDFNCSFWKPRRKRVTEEVITAVDKKRAKQILIEKYGKVKIKRIRPA